MDENGHPVECFGVIRSDEIMAEFLAESSHPIYELEILPVLVALRLWWSKILGAPVVSNLDNDSARSVLIRGDRSTKVARAMVLQFLELEKKLRISPWASRVPRFSNPADDASRPSFNVTWLLGVPRNHVVLPAQLRQWGM